MILTISSASTPPRDRVLSDPIPEPLRRSHDEARRCLSANAYAATVVMSTKTVEGACAMHKVRANNLRDQLAKMKNEGIIDGRLWEWAETLRGIRNSAAHFDQSAAIDRQDAEDSLAYSEALLDYLYVLKKRFDDMKKRRAKPPVIEEVSDQLEPG